MSFVFAFQSKMGNAQFISLLTYGFDDTVLMLISVIIWCRREAVESHWCSPAHAPARKQVDGAVDLTIQVDLATHLATHLRLFEHI